MLSIKPSQVSTGQVAMSVVPVVSMNLPPASEAAATAAFLVPIGVLGADAQPFPGWHVQRALLADGSPFGAFVPNRRQCGRFGADPPDRRVVVGRRLAALVEPLDLALFGHGNLALTIL